VLSLNNKIYVNKLERYIPYKHTIYIIYKTVDPKPIHGTEMEIATGCSNDTVKFNVWDTSRPSEESYSRSAYLWIASTETKEEIDKLKKEMLSIERIYQSKIKNFRTRIEELTKRIKEETNKFIEKL